MVGRSPVAPAPGEKGQAEPTTQQHGEADISNNPGGEGSSAPTSQLLPESREPVASDQNAFSSQLEIATPPRRGSHHGSFNMAQVATALPRHDYQPIMYPQGGPSRYPHPPSSPPMQHMHPMPHSPPPPPMSSYVGQAHMPMGNPGYYPQSPQGAQYYNPAHMSPAQPQSMAPSRGYYPGHVPMNPAQQYYYPHMGQYPGHQAPMPSQMITGQYLQGSPIPPESRPINAPTEALGAASQQQRQGQGETSRPSSALRGPPPKPRQSGHALWIGNLPSQTDVMSLVHHVSKVAPGLESVFLISKSNCAFANFEDEKTCLGAQDKVHESRFQSVRLVCRPRRQAAPETTQPTSSTSAAATKAPKGPAKDDMAAGSQSLNPNTTLEAETATNNDRFFILKSLTVEDLELSVRTGIWTTQSHNEEVLNNAFKGSDNVYLIFSANKSGEYFGYAQMTSEINDELSTSIESIPRPQVFSNVEMLRETRTPPTDYIQAGRIVEDPARGTIFWEGDRVENASDDESDVASAASTRSNHTDEDTGSNLGRPFKLKWLSTNRLPFFRTKGLRNPWNSNRDVKIARDGTEMEGTVGRRLIALFNRTQSRGLVAPMRPANVTSQPPAV